MAFDDFKSAQSSRSAGFEAALRELRAGHKTGHWIWYVFPQLIGLGWSPTARSYALRDLQEAVEYFRDPLLGSRLVEITRVVAERLARGDRLVELMGGKIDALKVVSSLTLFELAARKLGADPGNKLPPEFPSLCGQVLTAAQSQGFPRCPLPCRTPPLVECHLEFISKPRSFAGTLLVGARGRRQAPPLRKDLETWLRSPAFGAWPGNHAPRFTPSSVLCLRSSRPSPLPL